MNGPIALWRGFITAEHFFDIDLIQSASAYVSLHHGIVAHHLTCVDRDNRLGLIFLSLVVFGGGGLGDDERDGQVSPRFMVFRSFNDILA
jgi:hypothetical protein